MSTFQESVQLDTFDPRVTIENIDARNSDVHPYNNPHLRVIEEHRKSSHQENGPVEDRETMKIKEFLRQ